MSVANSDLKFKFADIFLLFSLFPYVSFNLLTFDTQPFAILVGLMGLFFSKVSLQLNKVFKISFVLVLIALFISSFSVIGGDYYVIRGIYNYLSIFFNLFIFSYLFRNNLINNKLIIFANYVYIFFAFVQIYFPQIINFMVPSRGDDFFGGRGLTSLTPEPSHLGINLILISMLLLICSGYNFKKNLFIHLINFLAIFLIVRNASLILIIVFSLILIGLLNINKFLNINYFRNLLIVSLTLLGGIIYSVLYRTRIFRILESINIENFKDTLIILINADLSISERLQHLLIPFLALYKDFGMPHAFDSLSSSARNLSDQLSIFLNLTTSTKFMSFMGDYVFSLGIFGIVAFLLIFIPLFKKQSVPNYLLILFINLLITSVPISNPLVPAVVAGFYYKKELLPFKNET